MDVKTVLITGGTGLVGTALTKHLLKLGYKVIILTRQLPVSHHHASLQEGISYALWNPSVGYIDKDAIGQADAIVHLAGAGVMDKRWTPGYKQTIAESRVQSAHLIYNSLLNVPNRVTVVVSASGIGWYGADKPGHVFVETDEAADDFLGQTCKQWEQALQPIAALGKRTVCLRTGIVLSKKGGAIPEFKKPLRFRVAAILGSGRQVMSWVHIDDLCRMYVQAIENSNMSGSYNAAAPAPVTNQYMTIALAKALWGKLFVAVHVPEWLLKLLLGESCVEVLKSATVSANKVMQTGFVFKYDTIEKAFEALCSKV